MKVAIDFDDTIANTVPAFLRHWYSEHPRPVPYQKKYDDIDSWNLPLILQDAEAEVRRVFGALDYAKVEPVFDAIDCVELIWQMVDDVQVVTANPDSTAVMSWLTAHGLGDLLVRSVGDKANFLVENHFNVLIDDKSSTCMEFCVKGGYSILMDRPWNRHWEAQHQKSFRVKSWRSALSLIANGSIGIPFRRILSPFNGDDETVDRVIVNEYGAKQTDIGARYDLLPARAVEEVAKVLKQGAEKYGEDNWRGLSVAEIHNHTIGHAVQFNQSNTLEDLSHTACRALMALEIYLEQTKPEG